MILLLLIISSYNIFYEVEIPHIVHRDIQELSDETIIRDYVEIIAGVKMKVVGQKTGEKTFNILEVRPFIGKGKGGNH